MNYPRRTAGYPWRTQRVELTASFVDPHTRRALGQANKQLEKSVITESQRALKQLVQTQTGQVVNVSAEDPGALSARRLHS
jgi:hypothetical protein